MKKETNDFVDKRPLYTASFARSSKAIGVLWGVFTICFAIIIIVIFIQPQWIGDTHLSKGTGYFGLWQRCSASTSASATPPLGIATPSACEGDLHSLAALPTPFQAATIVVGVAVVASLLCVCCLLLFFFVSPAAVFTVAGAVQLIAALFLLVGVCIYPLGFDAPDVAKVCGHTARAYNVGECEVRWAYLLAILGVLDSAGLSALAFLLGSRSRKLKHHIRMQQQQQQQIEPLYAGSLYKGHLNADFVGDGVSLSGSRKSLNLQPVMMMPRPDLETYSDYSHPRSKTPAFRPAMQYASNQNFQL